jgi:putative insertion element HTH domain-containing protein
MGERFDDENVQSAAVVPYVAENDPIDAGHLITDQQRLGVDLLAEGRRLGDVAKEIGVSRQQLWRWRKDPAFIVELHRVRAELRQRRGDRFLSLVDKSLDVLEQSLDEGDPKAATDILKLAAGSLSALAPEAPEGPEAPTPNPAALPSSLVEVGSQAKPSVLPASEPDNRDSPDGHACTQCGLVARTAHGLRRHGKASHSSGG